MYSRFSPLRLAVVACVVALAACGDDRDADDLGPITGPRVIIDSPANGAVVPAATSLVFHVEDAPVVGFAVAVGDAAAQEFAEALAVGVTREVPLALAEGTNDVTVTVVAGSGETAQARVQLVVASVSTPDDTLPPTLSVSSVGENHAVQTRALRLRITAADDVRVASVRVAIGERTIDAVLGDDGVYLAAPLLNPGDNAITVTVMDAAGNSASAVHHTYFGQRIASGAAHGGAIVDGALYGWGRNNRGQPGVGTLSYARHASYCDARYVTAADLAQCKASTVADVDAICANPGFLPTVPADSVEAEACRVETRVYRDSICDVIGLSAPADCKTNNSLDLLTLCVGAHGEGADAMNCRAAAVCTGAYAGASGLLTACLAAANVSDVVGAAAFQAGVMVAPGPFTSLAFSQNASAAIDAAGNLWTWGDNTSGELCLGDVAPRSVPTQVPAFGAEGTSVIAIVRGFSHLLIQRSDGSVWACGNNADGQLGVAALTGSRIPVAVQGLPADVIQVTGSAASSHALTSDGRVYAWGRNQHGNLGNGTVDTAAHHVPVLVESLSGVSQLASGRDHTLALTAAGEVYGWGLNVSLQVYGSDNDEVSTPTAIAEARGARFVYAGTNWCFYETTTGALIGWGQNLNGQLGFENPTNIFPPSTPASGIVSPTDVVSSGSAAYAVVGGQGWSWGWNTFGSLGAGLAATNNFNNPPVKIILPARTP